MHKQNIQQQYADLLAQDQDLTMKNLVNDLDAVYHQSSPPRGLTWGITKTRYMESKLANTAPKLPRSFNPWQRWSVSLSTALVLLLMMTTVTLATTVFSSQLRYVLGVGTDRPPGATITDADYTALNLKRTVNGHTVTLDAAYADGIEIRVGLSGDFSYEAPVLKTVQGQLFPFNGGYVSGSAPVQSVLYNSSGIVGTPTALKLVLDMKVESGEQISFNFTVPFHAGKVIALPGEKVTSGGITLTLEEMRVTHTGIIFSIDGLQKRNGVQLVTKMEKVGASEAPYRGYVYDDGRVIFTNYTFASDTTNKWTLTVLEKVLDGQPNPPTGQLNTWTFQVDASAQ